MICVVCIVPEPLIAVRKLTGAAQHRWYVKHYIEAEARLEKSLEAACDVFCVSPFRWRILIYAV